MFMAMMKLYTVIIQLLRRKPQKAVKSRTSEIGRLTYGITLEFDGHTGIETHAEFLGDL